MSSDTTVVLVIEDNQGDLELIRQMFAELKNASYGLQWAKKLKPALQFLSKNSVDVILADLDLPDSKGLDTVEKVLVHAPGIPVVVITGNQDEELACRAVDKGAQDYLVKGDLDARLLGRSIRYAIQRQEMRMELRKYARNLHGSNMRLMKILEQNADGMVIVNKDGRTVFMNSTAEKLMGRPRSELMGRPSELKLDGSAGGAMELPHENGESVSVEARVAEVEWEGAVANLVSLRDTTERSRHQQLMGQSAQDWQETFDAVTEMVFVLDEDFRVSRVNRTVKEWFQDKVVLGERLDELLLDGKAIAACLRQVTRNGEVERMELKAEDPEGAVPRLAAYPVKDAAGKVKRVVVIIAEGFQTAKESAAARARETAAHEAVARQTTAQQQDLETLKGQFSKVVSQEMAEPLAAMASSTERLLELLGKGLTTRQNAYLQVIKKNTVKLSRFAANVATVSRGGEHDLHARVVPVMQALRPVLVLQEKLAEEAKISVEILMDDSDDDTELMVLADPNAVTQVINNLLTNVIMHCPKGTNVTISHRFIKHENAVEISVADTGPGLPRDDLEKVFIPFYRGTEAPGRIQRGSGLGLSLCQSLVEAMGGKIWAVSSPGGGATFKFTLPASTASAELLFGKIALLLGYITEEQIQEVVAHQTSAKPRDRKIGELMLELGHMTPQDVELVLDEQRTFMAMPHSRLPTSLNEALLGRLAMQCGYLTEEQLNECLCVQEVLKDGGRPMRLGQLLVERKLMSNEDVSTVLRMQKLQIKDCPRCSSKFNSIMGELNKLEACPKCGAPLTAADGGSSIEVDGDLE